MKRIICLLIIILVSGWAVMAQDQPGTVKFPAGIDSPDSLFRASDRARSTLASSITTGATTIPLENASSFPPSGSAIIESGATAEVIYYTSKSGNSLIGVTRGVQSTTPLFFPANSIVRSPALAVHHNTLAAALIATQTKIGSGASTPAAGKFPKGTGPGTSEWGDILMADVTGLQAALDAKATAAALSSETSTRASADTTLQSNITAEAATRAAADAALQPLDSDLTAMAALAPSNDDVLQRKSGAWINRSIAQLKADFALAIADVSGLQTALDAKVAATRAVNTTSPIEGGGSLASDRTIACSTCVTAAATLSGFGYIPKAASARGLAPSAIQDDGTNVNVNSRALRISGGPILFYKNGSGTYSSVLNYAQVGPFATLEVGNATDSTSFPGYVSFSSGFGSTTGTFTTELNFEGNNIFLRGWTTGEEYKQIIGIDNTDNVSIDADGLGTKFGSSIQVGTMGTKPPCNATSEFTFWTTAGGVGEKSAVEVCAKAASNVYAWRTLY